MTLRFRRSVKLLPGVHLNLGLHSAGLSVGPRGLHVGVNRRGMYTSMGIPGTGIYAIHHVRTSDGSAVAGDALAVLILAIFAALILLMVIGELMPNAYLSIMATLVLMILVGVILGRWAERSRPRRANQISKQI